MSRRKPTKEIEIHKQMYYCFIFPFYAFKRLYNVKFLYIYSYFTNRTKTKNQYYTFFPDLKQFENNSLHLNKATAMIANCLEYIYELYRIEYFKIEFLKVNIFQYVVCNLQVKFYN